MRHMRVCLASFVGPAAVAVIALVTAAACGSSPSPERRTTPAATETDTPSTETSTSSSASATELPPIDVPTEMVDLGAGPDGRPRSIPAVVRLRAHLPGAATDRYLHATLTIGLGTESTITGCVAGVEPACEETARVVLSAEDHEAFTRAWNDIAAMPRCEPLARFPGDRLFTLALAGARYDDPLPADPAQIAARTAEPCAAPARMAAWIIARMRAG